MDDDVEVVWEEPPPKRQLIHPDIVQALRNNPGEWARVEVRKKHISVTAWKRAYPDLEIVARKIEDSVKIYARAIDGDPPPTPTRSRGFTDAMLDVIQDSNEVGLTIQEITDEMEAASWKGSEKTSLMQRVRNGAGHLSRKGLIEKDEDRRWSLVKRTPRLVNGGQP
jgi:hypothetical protein